jgi:transcriptional regulator GlxA family with amidase domain
MKKRSSILTIAILLFENYTALDIIGPYEILSKLPGTRILLVGTEKKEYKDMYGLRIIADNSFNEISHADVLLIPGGFGIDNLIKDQAVIEWIKKIDITSQWTVAVCSGSILLAAAGLLNGKNCTTHWRRKQQLREYNVNVKDERYVQDGKFVTSAGVSAGIDMALYLVSKIAGDQLAKMIQLGIEYDPHPPFDCGSPQKISTELLDRLKK